MYQKPKKCKRMYQKSLADDLNTKEIFGTEKNICFLEYLLEILHNKKPGTYRGKVLILNPLLPKTKRKEKGLTADILVKIDGDIYNIEMYTSFSKDSFTKSKNYAFRIAGTAIDVGDQHKKTPKVIQYNFVIDSSVAFLHKGVVEGRVIDIRHDKILGNDFGFFIYNMSHINKAEEIPLTHVDKEEKDEYTMDRREDLVQLIKFIRATSKRERKEIAKGSEMLMAIEEALEKFLSSENAFEYKSIYNKNREMGREEGLAEGIELGRTEGMTKGIELGRTEGVQLGRRETQQEVIKNLFQKGMNSQEISEVLNITPKTVDSIHQVVLQKSL